MHTRRFDLDWLRVIAIGLLVVYHCAIAFQPWAAFIGFPVAPQASPGLWPAMMILNIWRIPLLFFVSGMGFSLACRRRSLKALWKERWLRIGVPLVVGSLLIVPLQQMVLQASYAMKPVYKPAMQHLWFLGNILVYVALFSPLMYLLPEALGRWFRTWTQRPWGQAMFLLLVLVAFVAEAVLMEPMPFELYAFTGHGWVLGALAFLAGILLMAADQLVWVRLGQFKFLFLLGALGLYMYRLWQVPLAVPLHFVAMESCLWILGIFGAAFSWLNRPSHILSLLKEAAYPVYILHMLWIYSAPFWLFPLGLPAIWGYGLLCVVTVAGSLASYILLIRNYKVTRMMFGLPKT